MMIDDSAVATFRERIDGTVGDALREMSAQTKRIQQLRDQVSERRELAMANLIEGVPAAPTDARSNGYAFQDWDEDDE